MVELSAEDYRATISTQALEEVFALARNAAEGLAAHGDAGQDPASASRGAPLSRPGEPVPDHATDLALGGEVVRGWLLKHRCVGVVFEAGHRIETHREAWLGTDGLLRTLRIIADMDIQHYTQTNSASWELMRTDGVAEWDPVYLSRDTADGNLEEFVVARLFPFGSLLAERLKALAALAPGD